MGVYSRIVQEFLRWFMRDIPHESSQHWVPGSNIEPGKNTRGWLGIQLKNLN